MGGSASWLVLTVGKSEASRSPGKHQGGREMTRRPLRRTPSPPGLGGKVLRAARCGKVLGLPRVSCARQGRITPAWPQPPTPLPVALVGEVARYKARKPPTRGRAPFPARWDTLCLVSVLHPSARSGQAHRKLPEAADRLRPRAFQDPLLSGIPLLLMLTPRYHRTRTFGPTPGVYLSQNYN